MKDRRVCCGFQCMLGENICAHCDILNFSCIKGDTFISCIKGKEEKISRKIASKIACIYGAWRLFESGAFLIKYSRGRLRAWPLARVANILAHACRFRRCSREETVVKIFIGYLG